MEIVDIIIVAVLAVILGFAIWYIRRAKKKGVKCIGCPSGGNCAGCGGCSCNKAADGGKE